MPIPGPQATGIAYAPIAYPPTKPLSLADAQHTIEAWRVNYNVTRPHSGLDSRTPQESAMTLRGTASSPIHRPGMT